MSALPKTGTDDTVAVGANEHPGRGGLLARARGLLSHHRLPAALPVIAMILSVPSLWLGLQADDHILRLAMTDPPLIPHWSKGPAGVFAFFTGEPALQRQFMETGVLPWWTPAGYRVAFFRPLTGLTHWLDFRVWPAHPAIMHLQSLAWFGAMVAAAAFFYRRILGAPCIAGLAALIFAVDDAHGLPSAWLANRNALVAGLFGILALLAHDAWRRKRSRWGMLLAPVSLLLALAGGELGVAACAYLFAYALFMDDDVWRGRLASLAPSAAVAAGWALAYRGGGFGASGSGLYVDPTNPRAFLAAIVERGPILIFGQWFLPSDLYVLLSQGAARILWLAACGLMVVLAILLAPIIRRERVARFLGLGMVLSVLPACGTFPNDRLLLFVGLGGAGLLALFLSSCVDRPAWLPRNLAWRALAGTAFWVFIALHLALAPLGLARGSANAKVFGAVAERAAASLPADAAVRDQQVLVVNAPSFFVSVFGPTLQLIEGRPLPQRMLVLASGIYPMTVSRPSGNVLVIRPEGGFLAPAGSPRPGGASGAAFDLGYAYQMLDGLYRDATPFRLGERIELPGLVIEVTELTPDLRPAEASYVFETSLDDSSKRWLRWSDGVYVPFAVPRVGESLDVPAATVPIF